jgi:hypothetical protein
MRVKKIAQKVLVGKLEEKRQLGRPRGELEHNTEMLLQHKVCQGQGLGSYNSGK